MQVHWFLPTAGDSHGITGGGQARTAEFLQILRGAWRGEPFDFAGERIAGYHDLGIEHFILSGQPHLEEAYRFGEGVLPLLKLGANA